jgi:2-aminoadipate transaminase
MNPSVLRELLKVTEQPGIINLAGGLPSPQTFPIEAIAQATQKVLTEDGQGALQYVNGWPLTCASKASRCKPRRC